jgi:hypothetical protein
MTHKSPFEIFQRNKSQIVKWHPAYKEAPDLIGWQNVSEREGEAQYRQ